MSGFTLGGTSGATLGGSSGGTLGESASTYQLDGQPLPGRIREVATHRTLTLKWRVRSSVLVERLRTAKTDEDQIDVLVTDSGGFTAVDRAGGANTFELTTPTARSPLRQDGTYHVARYEETLVSQEVEEWDVEIEFVRDRHRTDSPSISVDGQVPAPGIDSGGTLGTTSGFTLGGSGGVTLGNDPGDSVPADWWGIETRYGALATDRVDANFLGTGGDGVERFELIMRLSFEQSLVLEAALSRLDGVRVREVTDGSNVAVDDTEGSANTLTVDSPTEDVVSSGRYVAMGWESTRLNDAYQEVALEIAVEG